MLEWVRDLSCWLFRSEHSADWWMVVVTAVAVAAAIWAGLAAYDQLQLVKDQLRSDASRTAVQLRLLGDQVEATTSAVAQAREASDKQLLAMQASREAALRPHLTVESAVWGRSGPVCVAVVRNVGVGPALDLRVKVRWRRRSPRQATPTELREWGDALTKEAQPDEGLLFERSALGTGQVWELEWLIQPRTVPMVATDANFGVVMFEHSYADVFGNPLPGKNYVFEFKSLDFRVP